MSTLYSLFPSISDDTELRIYEALGVRQFRNLLFRYERIRHFHRGGKYANYHLSRLSAEGAEAFLRCLQRNTMLHAGSQLLLILFGFGAWYRGIPLRPFVPLSVLLSLLNIWCLMLQRYNFLRIRRLRRRNSPSPAFR